MDNHAGFYDYFYQLRTRAYAAQEVTEDALTELFPPVLETAARPAIFCSQSDYCSHILKMGWLLGDSIRVVTPHLAFKYTHMDVTNTHSYPETLAVDAQFFEWRDTLRTAIDESRIEFIPFALLRLVKTSDLNEKWDSVGAYLSVQNIIQPDVVPFETEPINSLPSVTVDLPQLIIRDIALLRKVKADYPIAAIEFQNLLRDARALASKNEATENAADTLERIREDIVLPGVNKIHHEYRQLMRSHAVSTAIEVSGVAIPLMMSFATTPEGFFTQLLGPGAGLLVARGVNRARVDLAKQKNGPFYAAMKLGLQ